MFISEIFFLFLLGASINKQTSNCLPSTNLQFFLLWIPPKCLHHLPQLLFSNTSSSIPVKCFRLRASKHKSQNNLSKNEKMSRYSCNFSGSKVSATYNFQKKRKKSTVHNQESKLSSCHQTPSKQYFMTCYLVTHPLANGLFVKLLRVFRIRHGC